MHEDFPAFIVLTLLLLFSYSIQFLNHVKEKHLGSACYAHRIRRFKKETPEFVKVKLFKINVQMYISQKQINALVSFRILWRNEQLQLLLWIHCHINWRRRETSQLFSSGRKMQQSTRFTVTSAVFSSIRKHFVHVRYRCSCLANWTLNKTMETICQEKQRNFRQH
jgi:hypothetical protein